MKKKTKIYRTNGWAVVTKLGKVKIDTICMDRESVEMCMSTRAEEMGAKVKRVSIICEFK